ncbi:MAG: DNA polymerase III subunit delta' [Ideonella sp. MAG2]|nr:MAG: DNA polymerase III subunit delta' [Ideonella sp. MAG2]
MPWLAEPLAQLRDGARGHALILHGPGQVSLLSLAFRLAQAWLCEQPPGPCDQCPSCHLSLAGSHADLMVLMPETHQQALRWGGGAEGGDAEVADGESKSKRKPSREIRVEAVRQAIAWAHGSSSRGRGKMLVLYPADAMNVVAANALLKTLEEPAAGMRILLCVEDPERLLPTIRSRCQRAAIAMPKHPEALAWLSAKGVNDPETLLRAAGGEPQAALALQEAGLPSAAWHALPGRVAAGDASALTGLSLPLAVRLLQQLCHDAMAVLADAPPQYFPLGSVPKPANWVRLLAWQAALLKAARHDEHPWNAPLLLEALVAQAHATFARKATGAGKGAGRSSLDTLPT